MAAAGALAIGCGDSRPRFAVAGRVVFTTGQPVTNATVKFVPEDGGPAPRAPVDGRGRFRLATYRGGYRVPAGSYRVAIVQLSQPAASVAGPPARDRVDPRYESADTSGLRIRVGDGPTEDLVLRVEPAPPRL